MKKWLRNIMQAVEEDEKWKESHSFLKSPLTHIFPVFSLVQPEWKRDKETTRMALTLNRFPACPRD